MEQRRDNKKRKTILLSICLTLLLLWLFQSSIFPPQNPSEPDESSNITPSENTMVVRSNSGAGEEGSDDLGAGEEGSDDLGAGEEGSDDLGAGEEGSEPNLYGFGGFLSPLGKEKHKIGATIPVKFQITDAFGNFISTVTVYIDVDFTLGIASGSSNIENIARARSNKYVFNLKTKNLMIGSHTLSASIEGGNSYDITIIMV